MEPQLPVHTASRAKASPPSSLWRRLLRALSANRGPLAAALLLVAAARSVPGAEPLARLLRSRGVSRFAAARAVGSREHYLLCALASGGGRSYLGAYGSWWTLPRLDAVGSADLDVRLIILANTAIFLAWQIAPSSFMEKRFMSSLANTRLRPYTLLTSMFSQQTPPHWIANMQSLAAVAPLVQRRLGRLRFLQLYLLSGLSGSVASLVTARMSRARQLERSLGASGAVYGLLAAAAMMAGWGQGGSVLGVNLSAAEMLGARCLAELLDPPKGIAVWAHAGGAAFGAVATAVWANDGTLWPLLSPAILLMALL